MVQLTHLDRVSVFVDVLRILIECLFLLMFLFVTDFVRISFVNLVNSAYAIDQMLIFFIDWCETQHLK